MITDLEELQDNCLLKIDELGYSPGFKTNAIKEWANLKEWMQKHHYSFFTEEVARLYCEDVLGFFVLPPNTTTAQQNKLRPIRMLVSFQKDQSFEVRCPRADHSFKGPIAQLGEEYLKHLEVNLERASRTLERKRWTLFLFLNFIGDRKDLPASLCLSDVDAFLKSAVVQKAGIYDCTTDLRQFLSYLFERNLIPADIASLMPKVSRSNAMKLPTTYTEDEVRKMLSAVDRSSATGKRDYLVLLLASEYGLRSSDIATLQFGEIDWDAGTITHRTAKTGEIVKLPLLSTIGNALIDYVKNGRPDTHARQVIVRHSTQDKGEPLNHATIFGIVSKYLRLGGIEDLQKRKHGPHALRFSLATAMLKQNTPISVISQVLGHRSIETTQTYVKVDRKSLGKCPLPMPPLKSAHYTPEGHHAKL